MGGKGGVQFIIKSNDSRMVGSGLAILKKWRY